ncbi:MAG TPA: DUF6188 family protein [Egibacteraceae bacterium]|nr:DUF6188 family protein [Egibacteraceae bacterium]
MDRDDERRQRAGLREKTGAWVLPVAGGEVTQVRIDYAFGLIIQSGEFDVRVRVSTPFSVDGGHGAGTYDSENTPSLGPLLTFHKVAVEGGEVRKDGRLALTFRDVAY